MMYVIGMRRRELPSLIDDVDSFISRFFALPGTESRLVGPRGSLARPLKSNGSEECVFPFSSTEKPKRGLFHYPVYARIRSAGVGWNFAFVFTMILNPGIFSAYLICISLLVLQLREFLMKI